MIFGLALWFATTLGFQQYGENYDHNPYLHAPIIAEIEIHAENEWIDIYGLYKNEMEYDQGISFNPIQDYFTVGTEISFSVFAVKLEHMCQHPVGNLLFPPDGEYGGYTKIEISLSSK